MRNVVGVFVHGIFSVEAVWTPLFDTLRAWRDARPDVQLTRFGYPSPRVAWNPLRRIPDLKDLAASLATFLETDPIAANADVLVLIGHSQGGLVILEHLARAIRDGDAKRLARISECLLVCTPSNGSQLLLSVRKGLGRLWHHAQEERLRPLNEAIGELQRTIAEHVVFASAATEHSWPIRITACVGREDQVVSPASSRWIFPQTCEIEGAHSDAIRPASESATIVRIICGTLERARYYFPADGAVIRTTPVTPGDRELLQTALDVMKEAFPSTLTVRLDDLQHWLDRYERTFGVAVRVVVGQINDKVAGLLMFHEDPIERLIVIDYLASIGGDREAQILTRKLVARLKEAARAADIDRFVAEVDLDGHRAAARIRLFRGLGARVIDGLNYSALDMNRVLQADAWHPHALVYATTGPVPPASLSRKEVDEIVTYLYEKWYERWLSHRCGDRRSELDAFLQRQTAGVLATIAPGAARLALK